MYNSTFLENKTISSCSFAKFFVFQIQFTETVHTPTYSIRNLHNSQNGWCTRRSQAQDWCHCRRRRVSLIRWLWATSADSNSLALFNYAQQNKFAIPAINVTSSSTVVAALEAARDKKSPIILQTSQGGAAYFAGKVCHFTFPVGRSG